jgi:hypothetical protein
MTTESKLDQANNEPAQVDMKNLTPTQDFSAIRPLARFNQTATALEDLSK